MRTDDTDEAWLALRSACRATTSSMFPPVITRERRSGWPISRAPCRIW